MWFDGSWMEVKDISYMPLISHETFDIMGWQTTFCRTQIKLRISTTKLSSSYIHSAYLDEMIPSSNIYMRIIISWIKFPFLVWYTCQMSTIVLYMYYQNISSCTSNDIINHKFMVKVSSTLKFKNSN